MFIKTAFVQIYTVIYLCFKKKGCHQPTLYVLIHIMCNDAPGRKKLHVCVPHIHFSYMTNLFLYI